MTAWAIGLAAWCLFAWAFYRTVFRPRTVPFVVIWTAPKEPLAEWDATTAAMVRAANEGAEMLKFDAEMELYHPLPKERRSA